MRSARAQSARRTRGAAPTRQCVDGGSAPRRRVGGGSTSARALGARQLPVHGATVTPAMEETVAAARTPWTQSPVGWVRAGSVEKTLPRCKGQRGMKCSAEGPRMDVVIRP